MINLLLLFSFLRTVSNSRWHSTIRRRRLTITECATFLYISFPITRGGKWLIVSHRTCTSSQMQLAQRRALRDVNQSRAERGRRSFNLLFRGRCQVQFSAAYAFAVLDINANDAYVCRQGRLGSVSSRRKTVE